MSENATFDYSLPPDLIAQQPLLRRADARLMIVDRQSGQIEHAHVRDLPEYLRAGDCLITNNTQVVPARLVGYRTATKGHWEGLFLSADDQNNWRMLCKARGKLMPPETITLVDAQGNDDIRLWLVERQGEGVWIVHPANDEPSLSVLNRVGRVPIPPYIRDGQMLDSDRANYQTVFAKTPGAVAAPTAGLHFTTDLLAKLQAVGVNHQQVTLHVGLDTFRPITVERIEDHPMHSEWGELSQTTADAVNACHQNGGRVVAVGSTSVRVLESAAKFTQMASTDPTHSNLQPWSGMTDLFIRTPYHFRAVDLLMTNFHLPRTTLLVMICAFAGRELMERAYRIAIEEKYRFYSYGDAMLIL